MAKIEDLSHNFGYSRTSIIGTRGTGRNRPDNMNINEEQKLIILRERHLIVKQNIHKSFLKKVWSTPSLSVENTSTSVY